MKRHLIQLILISVFFQLNSYMVAQALYSVKSLDLNTREYDEFAPVIYKNGLVFNTYRKQSLYKVELDLNEQEINDLYFAQKLNNEKWGSLSYFSNELNTKNHEGKATFSSDGNTIFFTRFSNDSAGNIYRAVKAGDEWKNQVLISINSNEYRIKDPCISSDGRKLYFSSRAPGGYGGYDIYVSTFENDNLSTPQNLGPLINTKGDEVAPYFQKNGRLYFSSNGLKRTGGYDIYYSKEIKGSWILPKCLPEPINSIDDDLYYFSDDTDSLGYFSSNRNHSFDIFSFKFLWPEFGECKPLQKNVYTYIFSEKGSVDNDTTSWLYEWDFGDSTKLKSKTAQAEHTFASKGQYIIQLNVVDTLTGEVLVNENAFPFEVADIEQAFISCSDTLTEGVVSKFDASLTNLPEFKQIQYYYWDFGDGEKVLGIKSEHIYDYPGAYTVKLLVTSIPDEKGAIRKSCVSKVIVVNPRL